MDASAEDEGAQLLGLFRGGARAWKTRSFGSAPTADQQLAMTCSAATLDGNATPSKDFSSKGLFDVYKLDDSGVSEDATLADVPATVTQFNMAAGDLGFKQYQDDLSTRLPWADVEDDDIVDDELAAYHFFDATAEEATAGADPQKHRTQCGPLPQTSSALDFDFTDENTQRTQCGPVPHTPCSLGDDLAVEHTMRTQCGPVTQTSSVLVHDFTDKHTQRTQSGPMPLSQFALLPGGSEDPGLAFVGPSSEGGQAGNLPQRRQRTQCGPLPQTSGALDVDFTEEHTQRTQCGPVPHTPCALGEDIAVEQTMRTQCGPVTQTSSALVHDFTDEHTPRTQCGSMPHAPCDLGDDFTVEQILRTQCGPSPHTSSTLDPDFTDKHTPRTQCGPMPHTQCDLDDDLAVQLALNSGMNVDFMSHARAVLPDVFPDDDGSLSVCSDADGDFEGVTVFDLDEEGNMCTQDAPCTSPSLNTTKAQYAPLATGAQCGPLPQPSTLSPLKVQGCLDLDITSLGEPLAQLVATASIPSASLDARYAALAAYSDATQKLGISLGLFEASWTDVQTLGTQSGPLPQPDLSSSAFTDTSLAQYSPQEPETQCGPWLQFGPSRIQASLDNISAQYAPQKLEATRILPTTRTQCGPLPQPGSSSSQANSDTSSAQHALQGVKTSKRNGKRRGKGTAAS